MNGLMGIGGSALGLLGVLACLVAGVTRLMGNSYLAGFEAMTLFNVGMGFMVAACLAKLHVLGQRG
jgi:hypothetical protein